MGPKNHIVDKGQDRMNPFTATRGDKTAMWPLAKLLLTLNEHKTRLRPFTKFIH